MRMMPRAFVFLAVGAIGLAACDATPPSGGGAPEATGSASGATGGKLTAVLRDVDPYARARALAALLPTLGPEAVPEVEQALEDWTLDLGGSDHELLVRFWASHEPEKATRWAAEVSPLFYRNALVMTALPYWVEADLQAALVAVQTWQKRPEVRESAARGLVLGWYEAGLPGLTQYIQDLGVTFDRQVALITYLRAAMRKEGVQAVTSWAEALPDDDPGYKLTVFRQVASALPLFDHAAAMHWCEAHCDGPYGSNLRDQIAARWVVHDGPSAMAWLASASDGHEKDISIRGTFASWASVDREAALAWMAEQVAEGEPPAWLKPAFPVYARLLADDSPLEAIEWAQRIEKEREREIVLIQIARQWREADQAAADAWLERSPLSEEARAKVRDPNWRRGLGAKSEG